MEHKTLVNVSDNIERIYNKYGGDGVNINDKLEGMVRDWVYTNEEFIFEISLVSDKIYIKEYSYISCVDSITGEEEWRISTRDNSMILSDMCIFNDNVLFSLKDDYIYSVNRHNGSGGIFLDPENLEGYFEFGLNSFLRIENNRLYYTTNYKTGFSDEKRRILSCVDTDTNEKIYDALIWGAPMYFQVDKEDEYTYITTIEGWFSCIDNKSGDYIWLEPYDFSSRLIIKDEHIYFVENNSLLCINKHTGQIVWESKHSAGFTSMVVSGDKIYCADGEGNVYFTSIEGEAINKMKSLKGRVYCVGEKNERLYIREEYDSIESRYLSLNTRNFSTEYTVDYIYNYFPLLFDRNNVITTSSNVDGLISFNNPDT